MRFRVCSAGSASVLHVARKCFIIKGGRLTQTYMDFMTGLVLVSVYAVCVMGTSQLSNVYEREGQIERKWR